MALLSGFLLDFLVIRFGWDMVSTVALAEDEHATWLFLASALVLALLLLWSALRGSWRMALTDLSRDLNQWRSMLSGNGRRASNR